MTAAETALVLCAVPVGLVCTGYGFAARLHRETASVRVAAAMLGGFSLLLFSVSVINSVAPLDPFWSAECVALCLTPLLRREVRHRLCLDVAAVARSRAFIPAISGIAVFLTALLWPLLTRPELVFHDGSSDHDAFFWIVGAEHLKRSSSYPGV